jgi:hypothetical protein
LNPSDRSAKRVAGFAWGALRLCVGVAVSATAVASCFTGSDGLVPPVRELYFPTSMLVSPGRTTLYVANSDFDLQYNGGTVQAVNLTTVDDQPGLRDIARKAVEGFADELDETSLCASLGTVPNATRTLHPGACAAIDYTPFVRSFATVGAFASGLTLVLREGEPGARLFASVRGDPSVTYFDVDDDRDPSAVVRPCGGSFCLECRGEGDELRCDRSHRVGENIFTSQRGLLMPTEPTGVASQVHSAGDAIIMPHQTTATASLVVNQWPVDGASTPFEATPSLEFLLEGLSEAPTGVAALPRPAFADTEGVAYRPGFVISYRASASLSVLRYFDDKGATPPRPFLVRETDLAITLSNDGSDSRGIAFDTTERDQCEANCSLDDAGCLRECLDAPVGFYLANRAPSSLLVGTLEVEANEVDGVVTSLTEKLSLDESVPMPIGPASVALGRVIGEDGSFEPRIFVADFDSRFITIYDPRLRRVETMIRMGRGPAGMAFDSGLNDAGDPESFLYAVSFTDSYLTIIDLDTRNSSYATPIVNVGPPVAPREEQ